MSEQRETSPIDGPWAAVAMAFGLTGLAVVQPLLDLFGRNPEFFVAGKYGTRAILAFGLVITLVPGVITAAVLLLAARLHVRAGRWAEVAVLSGLGALFGFVLLRGAGADRARWVLLGGIAGALVVFVLLRLRPGRLLLKYLAAGNALMLFSFAMFSPTSDLVWSRGAGLDAGEISVPSPAGPVVVIVLDELPLTTLLTPEGEINADRYPAFAELAESSTWFRNASSRNGLTTYSLPALLTGNQPDDDALPTYQDHPRNLFTLLGSDVPVHRLELVTDLCPAELCRPQGGRSLYQALRDAAVVYGHRVLPERFRGGLPAIDHSWGGFGEDLGGVSDVDTSGGAEITSDDPFARWHALPAGQQLAPAQAVALTDSARQITADPAVHLIHVALPHHPWILTPWGDRIHAMPERSDPGDPAYEWDLQIQYQLHAMQVGAADVALGQVMSHLREAGAWEDVTLVVVSDHGTSFPVDQGRVPTPENIEQILRVPLFVRAPDLPAGEVRDDPALLIDVLPSLIDLLGAETDWSFEGHSLFDGSDATVDPGVDPSFEAVLPTVSRYEGALGGSDWVGLAAVGDHAALVGSPLDSQAGGSASDMSWSADRPAELGDLPTPDGVVPQLLTGRVHGSPDRPAQLAVVVNGMIAGVAGGFKEQSDGWSFAAYLAPFLRDGANEIQLFEVVERGGTPLLRELALTSR